MERDYVPPKLPQTPTLFDAFNPAGRRTMKRERSWLFAPSFRIRANQKLAVQIHQGGVTIDGTNVND
jgi:hypothetical protein